MAILHSFVVTGPIKRDAASGVDGMTWATYDQDLDRRIEDLHVRVKRKAHA
jgi:RNA-directed DNA polymerase